jgi:hypothetical protein
MTSRDQRLALVLLGVIVLSALGFFGYQFYLVPMRNRDSQIASLEREVADREARVAAIRAQKAMLDKYRAISLPSNVDQARREYGEELEKMLRASGFEAGSFSVLPKQPETRTSPTFVNKKPVYTKLPFTVTARGDLASLVEWMEQFYKLRLLHQIRSLSITVPAGADANARRGQNELDIAMTIEALILDNAENRKTLLPEKPPQLPPVLAATDRQYASIAGKNIFYGTPTRETSAQRPAVDVSPYVKFDGVSHENGVATASLYDQYHNHDYQIRPNPAGGFSIDVSYYINGRKRQLRRGPTLQLQDSAGEVKWIGEVVRIGDRELILRDEDQYYRLHVGESLADMLPLKAADLKALGIKDELHDAPAGELKDKPPSKDKEAPPTREKD